jgi:hypothetical protein
VAPLGEYIEASASRRERILKQQKYPPTFIVIKYEKARQAIRACLVNNSDVQTRLVELANTIEQLPPRSTQDADYLRLNAEAVRRFASLYSKLSLKGTETLLPHSKGFALSLEGVFVSVVPIVLLTRRRRDGKEQRGAMVGIFRKTDALGERGGKAVAELARMALLRAGFTNIRADLCLAVDVFSGRFFTASGSGKRVASEIECACREIAARWGAITATNVA